MAVPVLLIYNLDGQKRLKLSFICAQMRVYLRSVPAADYAQPLAALAGIRARTQASYAGAGFADEMLVMANFTPQQFHGLLDALRREKVQGIALKAVLTPSNAEWDSVKLHDELLREREALSREGKK